MRLIIVILLLTSLVTSIYGCTSEPQQAEPVEQPYSTDIPPDTLGLTKTSIPTSVNVGDTIIYSIVVTNPCSYDVTGVVFRDYLPNNLLLISVTPSTCTVVSNEVTCQMGTLSPGESRAVVIEVKAQSPPEACNKAEVKADNADGASLEVCTTINENAVLSLSVIKTATASTVEMGDSIAYIVTVTNDGTMIASSVILTDRVDKLKFIRFDSVTAFPSVTCSINEDGISCDLGDLDVGESVTLIIQATAVEPETVQNIATAQSGSYTATASCETTITGLPGDLSVEITEPSTEGQLRYFRIYIDWDPATAGNILPWAQLILKMPMVDENLLFGSTQLDQGEGQCTLNPQELGGYSFLYCNLLQVSHSEVTVRIPISVPWLEISIEGPVADNDTANNIVIWP